MKKALTVHAGARSRVLVVEDDPRIRFAVAAELRAAGYEISEASSCTDALARFNVAAPDVVVTDLRLPDGDALSLIPRLRAIEPALTVIVVTGYGTIDLAVSAVKQGADEFLTKPVDLTRLVTLVGNASARRATSRSSKRRRFVMPFTSASPQMQELERAVEKLRAADCSVLILGEDRSST